MGLDIAVIEETELSSFRAGSYSGFNLFRETLAEVVNIQLLKMSGYKENGLGLKWDENIPFIELLNHSDCEGKLSFEDCVELLKDIDTHSEKLKEVEEGDFQRSLEEWYDALKEVSEDVDEKRFIQFC